MEKKSDRIEKFVSSFEENELTNEQQATLLGGNALEQDVAHGNNCKCNGDNCDCNTTWTCS